MRKWINVGVVSAAVIIGGGLWVRAQQVLPNRPGPPLENLQSLASSAVISGNDIGFRVERWDGENPVGRLVVRRDGKWVEVSMSAGVRRLTSP